MNEKTFQKLLIAVLTVGAVSVIALLIYTAMLRRDCSIITYIANGR